MISCGVNESLRELTIDNTLACFLMSQNTGTEQHRHHAVEVAVYNLLSSLWELETGQVYKMTKSRDIYSGLGAEATAIKGENDNGEHEQEKEGDDIESLLVTEDDNEEADAKKSDDKTAESVNEKREGEVSDKPPQPPSTADASVPSEASASDATPPPPPTETEVNKGDDAKQKEETASAEKTKGKEKTEEQELVQMLQRAECIAETLSGIKIYPLVGPMTGVIDKPRYQELFDGAFVSSRFAQCIEQPYFKSLLKPDKAMIAVETAKFLVPLSKQVQEEFNKKIDEYAQKQQWKKATDKGRCPPVPRRRRDEKDLEDDVFFYTNF
jgi:Domain of unknown function (DUF4471)